ncbi:MAG TPA: hypothetical protein VGI74_08395 [Streptosporangiaceae bacterium]
MAQRHHAEGRCLLEGQCDGISRQTAVAGLAESAEAEHRDIDDVSHAGERDIGRCPGYR